MSGYYSKTQHKKQGFDHSKNTQYEYWNTLLLSVREINNVIQITYIIIIKYRGKIKFLSTFNNFF